MHIFAWVILIGLLMGLGLVLKRVWLARQADGESPTAVGEHAGFATQLTHMLRARVAGLRSRLDGKAQSAVVPQFRTWAASAFVTTPEIHQWLTTLTDEQVTVLTDHLAAFCRDMGFELSWLLDKQADQKADLMQGLTRIVLFYNRASYEAVKLQEEVEIFRVYYDYRQNPESRANRELGEHLFGKLMEQGMGTVSIAEHLASSARQRQQQIVETLHHAALEDPQTFSNTLKRVLIERTLPPMNGEGRTNQQPATAQPVG